MGRMETGREEREEREEDMRTQRGGKHVKLLQSILLFLQHTICGQYSHIFTGFSRKKIDFFSMHCNNRPNIANISATFASCLLNLNKSAKLPSVQSYRPTSGKFGK